MADSQSIDWRAIAIATIISFAIGVVISFAWGIAGLMLFAVSGSSEKVVDAVLSPTGYIVGFLVCLIPVVYGTLYLIRSVDHEEQKHCILFGTTTVVINMSLSYATGDPVLSWHGALYYAAIIPTALLTNRFADH